MTWRRVTAEFEADLYKVPKPRFFRVEKGELERKTYADGEERLEVRFHGIDVPEGTRVSVVIDGERVCEIAAARSRLRDRGCEIAAARGRGKIDLSSREGHTLPSVRGGAVAEIQHEGRALLRGTFRPD